MICKTRRNSIVYQGMLYVHFLNSFVYCCYEGVPEFLCPQWQRNYYNKLYKLLRTTFFQRKRK